ncbi:MBL fold metallo-hydrolase [Oryzifoliimicrobium ureilyticus]|uniref:MBL fold metallo-hydrolase n=1 Tax=Oryzifoliimicrobium ureilyticus TaxID=3113724 RepID=UPI00307640C5
MTLQLALTKNDLAPATESDDGTTVVASDLAYKKLSIVNVVFFGNPQRDGGWVLIDAGLPLSSKTIIDCAERRFGKTKRPLAIIMTHAHFDHAGSLETLARHWEVPIYAHPLEFPYLNGQASYPPADPTVGGGAMALLSPLFPRSPVDVSTRLESLPADQSVPGMPGWIWLATPGHSPGHISLWRESDRTLIAGDAVITTGQESVYEALMQEPEIHGPPAYFTPDWEEAEQSVIAIARLEPELLITGHGAPMKGNDMRKALKELAHHFREIAVPDGGTYAVDPAKAGKNSNDAYR